MGFRRTGTLLLAALMVVPAVGIKAVINVETAGAALGGGALPTAPRAVSAVPGNASATVTWKAPKKPGRSPVKFYEVVPVIGSRRITGRSVRVSRPAAVVRNLANAAVYRFEVRAFNNAGSGAQATSGKVRVGAPGQATSVATFNRQVVDGPRTLRVSAHAPPSNGAPITSYSARCTSSNGGATKTGVRQRPALSIVIVPRLTNGKAYRCTISATNSRGTGPGSAPSNKATV